MVKKELKVGIPSGLHAYNVHLFRQLVSESSSQAFLKTDKGMANAKDMISLLALNLKQNDPVEVFVDGIDEEEVMAKIEAFFGQT